MKRILVALDGSENVSKVMNMAIDLANKYEIGIDIMYIISGYDEYERYGEAFEGMVGEGELSDEVTRSIETEHKEELQKAEEQARQNGVKEVTSTFEVGNLSEEILDFADEKHVDLIVMGTIVNKVLHQSRCSVILVK